MERLEGLWSQLLDQRLSLRLKLWTGCCSGWTAFQSGGALDFMREKSLFSSAAAEERATVLEELGRVEELAAL